MQNANLRPWNPIFIFIPSVVVYDSFTNSVRKQCLFTFVYVCLLLACGHTCVFVNTAVYELFVNKSVQKHWDRKLNPAPQSTRATNARNNNNLI